MININANHGEVKASIRGNVGTVIKESAGITSALAQSIFSSIEDIKELEECTDLMLGMTADIIKDASNERKTELLGF